MKKSPAKFGFLHAVMADNELSSTAKCVVTVLLLKFRNSKTGQCNPSLASIAKNVGRTRRAVIPAIAELKQSGWVDIDGTKGGSEANTNHFNFDFSRRSPVQSTSPHTGEEDFTGEVNVGRGEEDCPRTKEEPSPQEGAREGEEISASALAPLALALVQFRQIYQRPWPDDFGRVGEAFIKAATENGGADDILASARRWAAAVEPRYLPEPVKWLEGLWRLDAPPKRRESDRHPGSKPSPAEVLFGISLEAERRGQ